MLEKENNGEIDFYDKKAIEAVRIRTPGATNIRVVHRRRPFLNGVLCIATFDGPTHEGGIKSFENKVYITENSATAYGFDNQLIEDLERLSRPRAFKDIFVREGLSGIIAVVLTVTICGMSIVGFGSEIPEILSTALTTILGFYFGQAVSRM